MERLKTITHQNKSIIDFDCTNFNLSSKEELKATLNMAKEFIAKQPLNSVLIVTDVTGSYFNKDILALYEDYTSHNKPYIKASAIVGIDGLLKIGFNTVAKSAEHDIHPFNTRSEALNWLAQR